MIAFFIVFLVGVAVGVGGTFAVLIIRARTIVKKFMKAVQEDKGGDPHED